MIMIMMLPMEVILVGIVTAVSPEQLSNTELPSD